MEQDLDSLCHLLRFLPPGPVKDNLIRNHKIQNREQTCSFLVSDVDHAIIEDKDIFFHSQSNVQLKFNGSPNVLRLFRYIPLRLIHFDVDENFTSLDIVFDCFGEILSVNIDKDSFLNTATLLDDFYRSKCVDSDGENWELDLPKDILNQYLKVGTVLPQQIIKQPLINIQPQLISSQKRGRPIESKSNKHKIIYKIVCKICNKIVSDTSKENIECPFDKTHKHFVTMCFDCSKWIPLSNLKHLRKCKIQKAFNKVKDPQALVIYVPLCYQSQQLKEKLFLLNEISDGHLSQLKIVSSNHGSEFDCANELILKFQMIDRISTKCQIVFASFDPERHSLSLHLYVNILSMPHFFNRISKFHELIPPTSPNPNFYATHMHPYQWADFLSSLLQPKNKYSLELI